MNKTIIAALIVLLVACYSFAELRLDGVDIESGSGTFTGSVDYTDIDMVSSNTIIIGEDDGDTAELPIATSTVIGRGASGDINDLTEATFKALFNLEATDIETTYIEVRNTTGVEIPAGKWVYASGASGQKLLIALASNAAYSTAHVIGYTYTAIGNNSNGFVVNSGWVTGQSTAAFTDGDELYLGTGGDAVTSKPGSNAVVVPIGNIVYANAGAGIVNVSISHPHVGVDEAYSVTDWNGDIMPPEKDDIRDYMYNFDADGDGSFLDETWAALNNIPDPTGNGTIAMAGTVQTFTFDTGSALRFQGTDAGDYWEFVHSAGNVLLRPVGGAFAQLGTFTVADGESALQTASGTAATTIIQAEDSDTSTYSPLIRAVNGAVPYVTNGGLTNYWKYTTDGVAEPVGGATLEIPNGTSGTTDATGEIFLDTNGDGGTNFSNPMIQLSTNGATMGYLFPVGIPTTDNYILKYDSSAKTIGWEADVEGDSVSVDGTGVVNPDFVSTGAVDFVNNSNSISGNINPNSINVLHFADGDYGDTSVSSNTMIIKDDAVQPDDIEYVVEEVFIPVSYMINGASAPDALATITSGTDKTNVRTFAGDADEDLLFEFAIPSDMDTTSGLKFQVVSYITAATAPSADTYQFELQGFSMGDGDALDGTMGTAQTSNSGSRSDAQYDRVVTAWSAALTSSHITDLAAGETVILKLYRDVDDTDTYAQLVGVSGISIRYKRNLTTTF